MSSSKGRIIDIQNFFLHDGPGIRTTIFFKGCPLRCIWCANPDTQKNTIELIHSQSRCMRCESCIEACPENVVSMKDTIEISRDRCILCGACIAVCPGAAMRFAGHDASFIEVLEEIENEKHFYRHSGGGVTLSGGEPLAQPRFAEAILKRCRQWGTHTAIETCGHAPYETLERVANPADTIYFDIKQIDNAIHKKYTRVGNPQILENLVKISNIHSHLIVRTPIILGINNSDKDLNALGNFLVNETAVTQVEFLNYHKLGEHKYTNLGRTYELEHLTPLTNEAFTDLSLNFSNQFPTLKISFHP